MYEQSLRFTDAALSLFAEARWLRHEAAGMARTACALYARAGRAAVCALLGARDVDLSGEAATTDLLELLQRLRARRDPLAMPAEAYARCLSRVLVLDHCDAGRDFVTRDLFAEEDVLECEAAASHLLGNCLQRLFGVGLEEALGIHARASGGTELRSMLPAWRGDEGPDP